MKYNILIVDRSGSMHVNWVETIGSINAYVEELSGDDTRVHVVMFDSGSIDTIRNCSKEEWTNITTSEISPRGSTPLYDAVGSTIDSILASSPETAEFIVITDGYENASREYTKEAIKEKVRITKERGFPLIFLGADFDAVSDVSRGIGISYGATMSYDSMNSSDVMKEMARTSNDFKGLVATGAVSGQSMADIANSAYTFSDEQRLSAKEQK